MPAIGVEYFFLAKGGGVTRTGLESSRTPEGEVELEAARTRGELVKYLIARCFQTKALFAHQVPQEWLDEKNVACDFGVGDPDWLGHTGTIVKADNELAAQALANRVLELAKVKCSGFDQLAKEERVAYDSQCNGGTEVGVRLVRGPLRLVKLCLDARIRKCIPVDHAVIPWMVGHVCFLLNVPVRGEAGITAWQRVRGRPFSQHMQGFGESIPYRYPSKGPHHAPDGNAGALGAEGDFLGRNAGSNTLRVVNKQGDLVAARSMTRRSHEAMWSADALAKIRVAPVTSYVPKVRGQMRSVQDPTGGGPTIDIVEASSIRKLRVNQSALEEHGYYTTRTQRTHIQRYGRAGAGATHTTDGRDRTIEAIHFTEGGRARPELQAKPGGSSQGGERGRSPTASCGLTSA